MEKNQNVFLGMQLKALREKNGYTMEKMNPCLILKDGKVHMAKSSLGTCCSVIGRLFHLPRPIMNWSISKRIF